MKYLTSLLLILMIKTTSGHPYCWSCSKHLSTDYDAKTYNPRSCNCPCTTLRGPKNRCIKCHHIHVAPGNINQITTKNYLNDQRYKPNREINSLIKNYYYTKKDHRNKQLKNRANV